MFPNKEEYTDLIIIIKLFHTEKKIWFLYHISRKTDDISQSFPAKQ